MYHLLGPMTAQDATVLDGLPLDFDRISAVGLVLLFAAGLATGRLFTKRQYDEVAHDRDEWRAEGRLKDQQIDEQSLQLRYMAEVGRTMEAILTAVHSLARSGRAPHEGDSG